MASLSVQNRTRSALGGPRRVFHTISNEVLPGWEISLVFVGPTRARELNKTLRHKSYTPNVLSYALGDHSGEIIICPSIARTEAKAYGLSPEDFVLKLFIHGALHIAGRVHGATMDICEEDLMARYASRTLRASLYVSTHRNRHRHRHLSGKDRRR